MENKNELARLWRKASILDDGTVLLGASHEICCDGFDSRSSIGVITHFHTDHIHGLERCLHNLDQVIVSEETRSLLIALKGNYLSYRMNLIPQKFGEPLAVSGGKLTLFPCKHVLGASQVLFENADGDRIVYTGDFDYPSTKPIPSDLLVIDATYGSPDYVHPQFKVGFPSIFAPLMEGHRKSCISSARTVSELRSLLSKKTSHLRRSMRATENT
jgi:hypothetical protein